MQTKVTGLVIRQQPVGELDRRITLLTRERGKIGVFARGVRRPGQAFGAATTPFAFGEFSVFAGRNAYTLADVSISNFFAELREDWQGACYGMYFAEVADYYCRENNDERQMLALLYQSLRALGRASLPRELVRAVYELKVLAVNGEYPGPPPDMDLHPSTVYALDFIAKSPVKSLYTFALSEEVLAQLRQVAEVLRKAHMDREFASLSVLEDMDLSHS